MVRPLLGVVVQPPVAIRAVAHPVAAAGTVCLADCLVAARNHLAAMRSPPAAAILNQRVVAKLLNPVVDAQWNRVVDVHRRDVGARRDTADF